MLDRIRTFVCLFVAAGALPALAGDIPGIKNFDRVDAHVYRGAQPTKQGYRYLAGIGVKTVIDLRQAGERAKANERAVKEAGMAYVNVPMSGLTPPTEAELSRILSVLEKAANGPVFVHCRRGADRTGAVIAAYRIDHDHWNNDRALKDAEAHRMGSNQIPRKNFIRNFRPETINAGASGATASTPGSETPAAVAQPALAKP